MSDDERHANASGPPSPTSSRRYSRKYKSFLPSASDLTIKKDRRDDEHTPLLKSSKSSSGIAGGYVRAADGHLTPKPRLSRHHSTAGECKPSAPEHTHLYSGL